MSLENGRNLIRAILILVFAAFANWVDLRLGLALVALMGLLILQSVWTDWCPADLFLKPLGMKSRSLPR